MLVIVSLNYAPGHFYAIYSLILYCKDREIPFELKLDNRYFLHHSLLRHDLNKPIPTSLTDGENRYIFVNSSLKHLSVMFWRYFCGAHSSLFMHEPMGSYKKWIRKQNTPSQKIKVALIKLINDLHMVFSKKIYVFSENGYNEIPLMFKNRTVKRRLLFPDLNDLSLGNATAKDKDSAEIIISYIGTISDDHNYEGFLQFAKDYQNETGGQQVEFKIFTRSIENRELPFIKGVFQGSIMNDNVIIDAYDESDLVWCGYKSANQSGVIPMAFMCSTIPIVSNVFNENILSHKKNCFFIRGEKLHSTNFNNFLSWYKSNKSNMRSNARKTFMANFSYKNFDL